MVEVFVSPRWYFGKVVAVKHRKNTPAKVKVKFDHFQKGKYDKWHETHKDQKLLTEDYPMSEDKRLNRKLTLVESLVRGADNCVRTANLRTAQGRTNRPETKLYLLEIKAKAEIEIPTEHPVIRDDATRAQGEK